MLNSKPKINANNEKQRNKVAQNLSNSPNCLHMKIKG